MTLLQIAEPGQSAAPHQHRRAVGIDLGTTNSLVATVRSGEAVTLPDEQGEMILPSVVRYLDEGVEIGLSAKLQASSDPQNTIISAKRMMGKALTDLDHVHLPYQFNDDPTLVVMQTRKGPVNPVQVSSEILKVLAMRAEQSLGGTLDGVVITVPAYFDDAQRQCTKDAARLAGLHILRLLNEPTAAAIAYGLDSGQEGVIAIYDLGGGTFDISILRLNKGVFEVLSTGGDSALGGDDFDNAILDWLKEQFELGMQLSGETLREVQQLACAAKQGLSEQTEIDIQYQQRTVTLTRRQFETLIQPLVQRTIRACRRALKDAEVSADEVVNVVMVGGSTRVPRVREAVKEFFGRSPLTSIDPDRVVALGAGIQADILVGNKPDTELLLLDVVPLSLGIELMGGLTEKVIVRNTTIPVAKAQEFTTFKEGQTAMAIHVLQGEREMADDCRSLARFVLSGIPPMAAGAAHIRVTFQVDADGLLSVTAMEKSSGVQSSIEVKPSYGLSDQAIEGMLRESIQHAKDDVKQRMLVEQQVEAERVLLSLESALVEHGDRLLSPAERQAIDEAMGQLKVQSLEADADVIKDAIEALDQVSADFAARRMDLSIRQALTGQNIDKV